MHATCVRVDGVGVVLMGRSGSGKSDLGLRLIDGGAELVADDRLGVARIDDRLVGRAPAALAGMLEIRGLGIMRLPHCAQATLGLVVDLDGGTVGARLPDESTHTIAGIELRCVQLDPWTASAAAKVRFAVRAERAV